MNHSIIKSFMVAVALFATVSGAVAQVNYDFSALNTDSVELLYKITGPQTLTVYGHVYDTADPSTAYHGTLLLPDTLTHDGTLYTVTAIGDSAFTKQEHITGVNIPATIDTIGSFAFASCDGLTSINIPEGVRYIKKWAFYRCNHTNTINIPSTVQIIDTAAFYYGSGNITIHDAACIVGAYCFNFYNGTVNLGNNVLSLGDYAFYYSFLHQITVPQSVQHIGRYAFSDCMYLSSLTLPDSLDTISDYMLECCYALRSLEIPSALKHIGENAFFESQISGPIHLPATLQSIGANAFAYSTALSGFVLDCAVPPVTDASAFTNVYTNIPIVVPCGTIEAYSTAPGWEVFSEFTEDCDGIAATADLKQISITPNPATDEATVLSSFGIAEVEVYDMAGISVLRQQAEGFSAKLNVKALPRGAYIVRIHTPMGITSRKLILQ